MTSRLGSWLQLFRAPNLFTVPGDPLMGFMLANFGIPTVQVLPVILASLCFYAAGLLNNDLADMAEDLEERPTRPLPCGAVASSTVWITATALTVIGLLLCAYAGTRTLAIGAALVLGIAIYNHWTKKVPVLGALNMGLCRALSVFLGASAAPANIISREAGIAALVIGLFIAAVTNLARLETKEYRPTIAQWLPVVPLLGAMIVTQKWHAMGTGWTAAMGTSVVSILLTLAMLQGVWIAKCLSGPEPDPLPPTIGKLIRLLLWLQAAFCAHTGFFGLIVAALLLATWPISRSVSKRFYAS